MDAPCKIQGSIHVFRLVNNMCPGKWVHIIRSTYFNYVTILSFDTLDLLYATSFHIVINPYNPSKKIIASIYIITYYHFTILKVW